MVGVAVKEVGLVHPAAAYHIKYNLEILQYHFILKDGLKWPIYCDIGNFTISTVTNNHDTLAKLESLLLKKIFSVAQ